MYKLVPVVGIASIFFIGGFASGFIVHGNPARTPNEVVTEQIRKNSGKLTSPLLECDTGSLARTHEFSEFEKRLNAELNTYVNDGAVSNVAVYFRNLLGGSWFGINEREVFSPASMLKVSVMIAVYKKAESNSSLLSQTLKYSRVYSQDKQYFDAPEHLEIGKEYSVDELVSRMIKFSDNESMFLLGDKLGSHLVESLYSDLKLLPLSENFSDYTMTVKDYSSFFRILFNSTYLSVELSNKALELLASARFNQGISANLPPGIIAAHKFGERTYAQDNSKQLHDCGIIYYPNNPYMLCVMTKGKDFESLASVIRRVSTTVFNEVDRRVKEN